MAMAKHRDEALSFSIMISCGAAVTAAMSWTAFIGFVVGVTTALAAAAVVGTDFDKDLPAPEKPYSPGQGALHMKRDAK